MICRYGFSSINRLSYSDYNCMDQMLCNQVLRGLNYIGLSSETDMCSSPRSLMIFAAVFLGCCASDATQKASRCSANDHEAVEK